MLELVTGGELFDQIVKEGKFDEDKARKYFRQLINGLSYCNTKGVCHRDLKPENLLLDADANLKISDFGLSALYTGGDTEDAGSGASYRTTLLHTTCGTPNYVAPEVLEDKGYDGKKADVWSCGVILYVLIAGFLPFDERTMPDLFAKIQKADVKYPAWFSEGVRDILGKILTNDPSTRLTISQILVHPWFTKDGTLTTEDMLPAEPELEPGESETAGAIDTSMDNSMEVPAAPPTPRTIAAALSDDAAQNTMTRTQSEAKVKRIFQFKTRGAAPEIVNRVAESLTAMECELKVFEEANKIKACKLSSKGMIGVVAQVYVLDGDLHMVEVRRGKGDILEYAKFYKELVEDKLKDIIEEIVEQVVSMGGNDDD